jgi:hypothetical protein
MAVLENLILLCAYSSIQTLSSVDFSVLESWKYFTWCTDEEFALRARAIRLTFETAVRMDSLRRLALIEFMHRQPTNKFHRLTNGQLRVVNQYLI